MKVYEIVDWFETDYEIVDWFGHDCMPIDICTIIVFIWSR